MENETKKIRKEVLTPYITYSCDDCKEQVFPDDNYCSECGTSLN